MYFQVLQRRLVVTIKDRVRNGEMTERGLARLSGVSQPHIHNVLKGARIFSPEFADKVLRQLKITVVDLCESRELTPRHGFEGAASAESVRWVPKRFYEIGPGNPWDETPGHYRTGTYPFPAATVALLNPPSVAILGEDRAMKPRFQAGDTVLLDSAEESRLHPDPCSPYLVHAPQGALVRYVRQGGRGLYLASEESLDFPDRWDYISLADRHILDIVRSRIVWMGRQMEP
ncbi:MAG: helix-turn-helix transcriptional regulator [Acidobacteriota bacterium]|nr:helix-turn-helix transcriptional regulator [Acidobacteriota bacterium]